MELKIMRSCPSVILSFIILGAVLLPRSAEAERNETSIGLQGGLMLPSFSSTSPTAFTLATWSAGAVGEFGLLDDLYLTAGFTFSMFDGDAAGYAYREDGLDYTGLLRCSVRVYHPQVGLKYKLYSGYNLAPYLEASFGYAWTTFHGPRLLNEEGLIYDVGISDFAEGSFTFSVGLSADYRLFNMLFVGVGAYFTYMLKDNLLEHYFSIPVFATYYW